MFFDDAVAHGEAQTCAATGGFGGEEWIEDAVNVLAGDAGSRVDDFDFDAAIVRAGAYFEQAAAGHGVAGVQKKIEEDLLEFVRGAADGRQRLAEVPDDLDLRSFQRMRYERKGSFDDAIYVNVRGFTCAGAREIQQVVHDFARAEGLLHDFFDDGLPRVAVRHLLAEHLNVIGDDRQRRVDFVRDAGRQETERGELLGLRHLLFHTFALGYVIKEQETADAFGGFADQRRDRNVHRERLALMMQPLFIDAGDLLGGAERGNFIRKLCRE